MSDESLQEGIEFDEDIFDEKVAISQLADTRKSGSQRSNAEGDMSDNEMDPPSNSGGSRKNSRTPPPKKASQAADDEMDIDNVEETPKKNGRPSKTPESQDSTKKRKSPEAHSKAKPAPAQSKKPKITEVSVEAQDEDDDDDWVNTKTFEPSPKPARETAAEKPAELTPAADTDRKVPKQLAAIKKSGTSKKSQDETDDAMDVEPVEKAKPKPAPKKASASKVDKQAVMQADGGSSEEKPAKAADSKPSSKETTKKKSADTEPKPQTKPVAKKAALKKAHKNSDEDDASEEITKPPKAKPEIKSPKKVKLPPADKKEKEKEKDNVKQKVHEPKKSPQKKPKQKVAEADAGHHGRLFRVAYSRCSDEQLETLSSLVSDKKKSALRCVVVDDVDDNTTHLVLGKQERTLKVLKAIARGVWVVSFDWIEASNDANQWADEAKYEAVKSFPGCRKARECADAYKKSGSRDGLLFHGERFYVTGKTQPGPLELRPIIEKAGGTIVLSASSASIVIGGERITDKDISNPIVSVSWLFDSIAHWKKLAKEGYPPPDDTRPARAKPGVPVKKDKAPKKVAAPKEKEKDVAVDDKPKEKKPASKPKKAAAPKKHSNKNDDEEEDYDDDGAGEDEEPEPEADGEDDE